MTNKKILTLISFLLLVSFLLVGCELFPPKNHVPVITTIALPNATVGTAYTATVEATDADGDALTFSKVSGPTDMVISEEGVISGWTPAAVGTEAVTVAVTDGKVSVSAPFTITVSAVEPIRLTSIVVLPETMTLFLGGESEDIESVTAYYSDGSEAEIDLDACEYESSDVEVATVSAGVVEAVAYGEATITVSYTEEEITKTVSIEETDTLEVTVVGLVHNITSNRYYDDIQKAIDDAWAGDTIEVAAETYNENIVINTSGLTVKSVEKHGAIIDAGDVKDAIFIGSNDVTVDGFTIGNADYGVQVNHGVANVAIKNNRFEEDSNMMAIYFNRRSGGCVEGNEIRDVRKGMGFQTDKEVTITGNLIRDCSVVAIEIYPDELVSTLVEFEIHRNNIIGNGSGILILPYNGIYISNTIDAEDNWWGDASGPTHSSNLGGTGDTVSDNVDYSPWSTEEN